MWLAFNQWSFVRALHFIVSPFKRLRRACKLSILKSCSSNFKLIFKTDVCSFYHLIILESTHKEISICEVEPSLHKLIIKHISIEESISIELLTLSCSFITDHFSFKTFFFFWDYFLLPFGILYCRRCLIRQPLWFEVKWSSILIILFDLPLLVKKTIFN